MNILAYVLLSALFTLQVLADTTITQLPLGSASSSGSGSVVPYVDTAVNVTKKMTLSDFVNIPALKAPQFCTAKALTGFVVTGGVVNSSDTILQAIEKLAGGSTPGAPISIGPFDGTAANSTGLDLTANVLSAFSATATNPGMINTGAQVFAGAKTFNSTIAGSINGNAATVTTNANLTGPITSIGNATSIASQTGTGTKFVVDTSPTIVTPTIAKIANLTTNGLVRVDSGNGTLSSAELSSEATTSGSNAVTLSNAAVIGKVLTGYTSGAGTVAATDSILQAIQKLNGNATPAAPTTVGTYDSQAAVANGLQIISNVLYAQSADATHPGMVNNTTQTLGAGTKTLANIVDSGLTASTVPYADSGKVLVSSAVTPTELGYVSGVTSAIQTQLNGKQASGNYITALTGDVTASGPGSVAATVAKIQSTTVSGTTGTTNVVFSSAPTLTNPVVGTQATSDNSTKAASTAFVQTALAQLNPAAAVTAASTANISGTYTNAVGGVCIGDTFQVTSTAAFSPDGVTLTVGQRFLMKDQTNTFQNGVWTLTTAANVGVLGALLTRALDFDSSADISAGSIVPVVSGTVNAGSSWYQTSANTTCNSDAQTWVQFQKASSAYASSTLTSAHLFVGNGSNVATDVAASGDLTLANTGAFTIANLAVTNAKIANSTIDLTAKVTGVLPVANSTVATQVQSTCNTAATIDWSTGRAFTMLLTNGATCAVTFSNKTSGQSVTIKYIQPSSTGSAVVSYVGTTLWSGGTTPTMTTGASKKDVCTFIYDGTDVVGSCVQDVR